MAELCPSNVLLHTYSLHDDPFTARSSKYHQTVYERDEKSLWTKLQKEFPEAHRLLKEKSPEYEEEFESSIVADFFLTYRKPWMVVGNEDARAALKGFKNQDDVYTIAKIHKAIALADGNMTEFTASVLQVQNPCPLSVLMALETLLSDAEPVLSMSDSIINQGFNAGCARDILRHLVR